ncbi:hypothetical protein WJX75_009850 [Coccomyxa subellipsoidea]|uniref:ABC transporter domain-containing protein n=1 Tax=Coccomyxa subellipsoidea TaxID=248742 RepID=A0ABR2YAU8_9CHLO
MAAIIGPSGAGKSTLLDALAARSAETVKGTVCIDGVPATAAKRSAESAYIPQEDHFIPSLTCFETLMVAARLRGLSASSIRQIVHGSLRSMGLQGARDTQVGGLLPGGLRVRGISGGEKRRLSIACGTIGAPRIIFLDEPTSGLDTSSALVVMRCIQGIMLETAEVVEEKADAQENIGRYPHATIWNQYRVLQGRATMAYARNPANVAGRTLMAVALGVLVGFVFFRKPDGVDGLRQSVGALFFAALLLSLMPYTYMSMFISDRLFFRDDPLQPLYLTAPYYAAVSGINAILSSLNGVIMMLIVYGLVALLHTARAVLLTVLVTVLHSLCSVQLLVFVANLTPNQDLAFVLGVTYTSLSVLLSGFFVRLADMHDFRDF